MKNRFLLVAALLPLLSFAYVDPSTCDFYAAYVASFKPSSTNVVLSQFIVDSYDSILNIYKTQTLGITMNRVHNISNRSITSPFTSTNGYVTTTASRGLDYQIRFSSPDFVTKYYSPRLFREIDLIYLFAFDLAAARFESSGLELLHTSGSVTYWNYNYQKCISDIISSTNSIFSQILLSHLSNISSSLSSIGSTVNSINSDYQQFNYLSLNPDYTVFSSRQAAPLTSKGDSIQESNLQKLLQYYDLRSYERSRALAELSRDNLKSVVTAIADPYSEFYGQDVDTVLNDPGMFQRAIQSGGGCGSVASIARDIKKLSTNDWVSAVTNDLANNRASITNQLAQNTADIKDKLDHMFESNDPSTTGRAIRDIAGNASTLASAVHNNRVVVTVENTTPVSVLLDGPINLDQSQFTQLSTPLAGLERRIDTWYQDWYSFFSPNVTGYNWIQFFDMVSSFKDVNHTDLVSLQSCVSNLLLSFRGDITNLVVSTNGYLLLSDYADYIHSGGLDTLLDVMDDDSYSDLKSEIDSLYHADTAEGYGRWWRYFTGLSTVQANSIFKLSNIFQAHEKLLKDLKRDNSDLDVEDASDPSVFRKLLYTIPSDEDTFNKLSQLTNSIDQSGMASIQKLIPDLTNRFNVAASLYDKDFVLPSEISWELIPADPSINSPARIVTIFPSEHYRLFQLLHFGLAFSYCLVNIILFPKFLLFLVRLFDRVWNKSEKLIYNSTQS